MLLTIWYPTWLMADDENTGSGKKKGPENPAHRYIFTGLLLCRYAFHFKFNNTGWHVYIYFVAHYFTQQ